jgi:hypothetical protein
MTKDWRLENLETFPHMRGVKFVRKPYRAYRPGWEHDHCNGCWTTLTEPGYEGEDIVHEGYATTAEYVYGAEYDWVCIPCFEEFRETMEWVDVTPRISN